MISSGPEGGGFLTSSTYQGAGMGGGMPAPAAGFDGSGIADLVRWKMAQDQEDKAFARQMALRATARPRPTGGGNYRAGGFRAPAQSNLREASVDDFGGPPIRYVSGPGIISGPVMDPLKMNSAQRRAYLPSSSQAEGSPEMDRLRKAAAEGQERENETNMMRQRSMMARGF